MNPNSVDNYMEFAHRALSLYGLRPTHVEFIRHSENITYRVFTPAGDYLLRVHTPISPAFGNHGADPAAVNSEMLWLAILCEHGFPVPPPVRTRDGKYTAHLDNHNLTMLEWQPGEQPTREMANNVAGEMGNLVGRLHQFASTWKPPHGFTRPTRDAAFFEDAMLSLWPATQDGRIDPQDYALLQNVITWLSGELRNQGPSRERFGLLHGDLHRGNFLLDGDDIRLIDFSMSAYGPYAYDLGTCLSNITPTQHNLFLENYTRHFALPESFHRTVEACFIASWVVSFSLNISDPESQETLIERVSMVASEYASRFDRDKRFWFSD